MAASVRRNTFTLKGSDLPQHIQQTTGMDRQNIMRLKVNRIAIVQELKVEHVLDQLQEAGILSEKEKKKIEKGTTPSDRARRLIDILPTKHKETEWYKHFRESLQNPDANVEFRKRYRDLVDFLDNTVIHRPASQAAKFSNFDSKVESLQYPKYEPLPAITNEQNHVEKKGTQNILNLEASSTNSFVAKSDERETEKGQRDSNLSKSTLIEDQRSNVVEDNITDVTEDNKTDVMEDNVSIWSEDRHQSMTLIKGFFHQWVPMPDNYRSLIEIPREQVKVLTDSNLPEDKDLLEAEKKAFQKMRKLEVVAALNRRKQLPQGFEIAMCDAFQEILTEPELHHLYLKYFKHINMSGINLITDITNSFKSVLEALGTAKATEATKQVVSTGLGIADLFVEFSSYADGEEVLCCLIKFLNTNPCIETWMAKYKGYVKLLHLRNKNHDFYGAQQAYYWSVEMTWAIKMMSFGQDLIDESEAFVGLSTMLLETGSLTPALGWANRALQEVNPDKSMQVIECLCSGVLAYCTKWQVKKAEMLAVQAVQMAKMVVGKRHPLYLKALLHFCHFSSEFIQDEAGIHAAKECLEIASRIYTCETVQLAMAHRAVSRALMVTQHLDTDDYYNHSMEAIRIARSQLPQGHPMLHIFLYTFASALQWKALHSPKEEQDSTLRWAEAEAKQALAVVAASYGEISLKTSQVYSLLGQIYSKMNRLDEAEMFLVKSVGFMKLCQNPTSNYLLLATATLATFYKIVNQPVQAIPLLRQVLDYVESSSFYLQWVHMCYDNLIKLLQAAGHNQQANDVQKALKHWLKENPTSDRKITLDTLSQRPPSYRDFFKDFDKWGMTMKKALKGISSSDNR